MMKSATLFLAALGVAHAAPSPQGVTALIAPQGATPDTCAISYPGTFGLSIGLAADALNRKREVMQIEDGQIQAGAEIPAAVGGAVAGAVACGEAGYGAAAVGGLIQQIEDGQIQTVAEIPAAGGAGGAPAVEAGTGAGAGGALTGKAGAGAGCGVEAGSGTVGGGINQIEDGQIQAPVIYRRQVFGGVTQIADGQVQAPAAVLPAPKIVEAAPPCPEPILKSSYYKSHSTYIKPAAKLFSFPVSPALPVSPATPVPCAADTVTQIADGQIQIPVTPDNGNLNNGNNGNHNSGIPISNAGAAYQIPDGQVQLPLSKRQNGVPLQCTLSNGVLKDNLGRTGYIADNRQFQFDGPPQSGAIYTSGFSACEDGTLALGGLNTFYACGSSDFNNLYDRAIYPDNCKAVNIHLA